MMLPRSAFLFKAHHRIRYIINKNALDMARERGNDEWYLRYRWLGIYLKAKIGWQGSAVVWPITVYTFGTRIGWSSYKPIL